MSIDEIKIHLGNYYSDGIIMPEECIKEMFECLKELELFRQLYPDTDINSSLKNNYRLGFEDGKKEIVNEIHKIYCTHRLSDEEVLEQIKLVLNREIMKL